jgi:hypothetical protein
MEPIEYGQLQVVRTCLSASSDAPRPQLDLNNKVSSAIRSPPKGNHYKQSHRSPMVISHHLADLVGGHVLDLLVRHLDHVRQLLSAAERRGRRIVEKCTSR